MYRFVVPLVFSLLTVSSLQLNAADENKETSAGSEASEEIIDLKGQAEENQSADKGLPINEIRRFSEVFDRIKKSYVEPVSDKKLLEDAVRGMLLGLDPHSSYLAEEAFSELQVQTSGQFGGIGVEVSQEDGVIRVITPMDDTPAMKAGIKPGDIIIKIDGQIIQSIGVDKAVSLMRGEVGTDIVLTIGREGESVPFDVTLTRQLIDVGSTNYRMLNDDFGYVRISQFQKHTGRDVNKALVSLKEENDLKGLVLDLRNNPGGLLTGAVEVVDAFVEDGVIVSTKGRDSAAIDSFAATSAMTIGDIPVVVIINGGSASASEIVAGALQDKKRAVILGTTSFGKGSVQTVLQLTGKRAIKLTTAKYYTPSGRSIQAKGIVPDIIVKQVTVKEKAKKQSYKEKDLAGHLENGDTDKKKESQDNLLERDFQLHQAINLLKGLVIFKQ